VHDTHGKRYLESVSGLWNIVAGFSEPRLVRAAHEAMQQMPAYHTFFGRTALPPIALAEKLVEIAPMEVERVYFTNSGSEANDTTIKMLWMMARGAGEPERRKLISRSMAYHGTTVASCSLNGKPYIGAFGLPLPEVRYVEAPHYWRNAHPGESEDAFATRLASELESLIEAEGPETFAGFFAEPVMGAGGAVPPPAGYFPKIQAVLNRHGIPLVADEVVTGLGRTGNLWGAETYAFTPDILVTSKALTSGYYPMAAVLLSPEMDQRLRKAAEEFDEFPHGFTTGGSPVAAAVALETIALITEPGGLLDNVTAVGPAFEAALQGFENHPLVGEVRCVGLLGALEIVADKGGKRPFAPEHEIGERIVQAAYARGLISRPIGDAVIVAPPFIISRAQIEEMMTTLGAVLDEIADTATREGMGPVPLAASAE
ncbi:MAG: aminotransferase, partial [Rhodospirillales bacterium]|nr:aminotransferase [Rhodospirillales bacterium]